MEYDIMRLPMNKGDKKAMILSLEEYEYKDLLSAKKSIEFVAKGRIFYSNILIAIFDSEDPITRAEEGILNNLFGEVTREIRDKQGSKKPVTSIRKILHASAKRLTSRYYALIVFDRKDEYLITQVAGYIPAKIDI